MRLRLESAPILDDAMQAGEKMKKTANGNEPRAGWKSRLADRLPSFGHRNWIGIVDSAYPEQVAPGVELLPTGEDHIRVVQDVFKAVDTAPHIRAIVHLDAELACLDEAFAPGIDVLRTRLESVLKGQEVKSEPHESIIEQIDEAGQQFHVLLLKTNLALPYTSLFLQLECGYWSAKTEESLRDAMSARLADPLKEGK